MKKIIIDEDIYSYIASQTQHIGENASDILRRLLNLDLTADQCNLAQKTLQENSDVNYQSSLDISQEMMSLVLSQEFLINKKVINRFMLVLSNLYRLAPDSFEQATKVRGRTRLYFAPSKEALLSASNTTKPKQIPKTPFWVITNNNSERKRYIVERLMTHMSLNENLISSVINAI